MGDGTRIGSFCDVGGEIGKNCKIQSYVFIPPGVKIGDNVFIGPGVRFTNRKKPELDGKNWEIEKTIVEDGAIIGAGAVILPGLRLGKHCFIGAGSVVTKDIPRYEVWLGNPAQFYKSNCPLGNSRCVGCGQC